MWSTEHKRFFFRFSQFLLILVLMDYGFGLMAKQLFSFQNNGKYARLEYAIVTSNAPVLIMGNSHAVRQYVPEAISKELGMDSYNVGAEGQQLLYQYAVQRMILKHRSPKMIILNIDEDWLYTSSVAYKRLADLHPFYHDYKQELRPILQTESRFMDYKLWFRTYQNNSTIVHILRYFLSPQIDYNGYRPLYGQMNPPKNPEELIVKGEYDNEEIDETFQKALRGFFENATKKKVQLVLVTSPKPVLKDLSENKSYQEIKKMSSEWKIPVVEFHSHPLFIGNYHLFNDPDHLNHEGSVKFSKLLGELLSKELATTF